MIIVPFYVKFIKETSLCKPQSEGQRLEEDGWSNGNYKEPTPLAQLCNGYAECSVSWSSEDLCSYTVPMGGENCINSHETWFSIASISYKLNVSLENLSRSLFEPICNLHRWTKYNTHNLTVRMLVNA